MTDKNNDFCSAGDAFPECEDNLQHGEFSNRLHCISVITSFIFAATQGACKVDIDHCLSLKACKLTDCTRLNLGSPVVKDVSSEALTHVIDGKSFPFYPVASPWSWSSRNCVSSIAK